MYPAKLPYIRQALVITAAVFRKAALGKITFAAGNSSKGVLPQRQALERGLQVCVDVGPRKRLAAWPGRDSCLSPVFKYVKYSYKKNQ